MKKDERRCLVLGLLLGMLLGLGEIAFGDEGAKKEEKAKNICEKNDMVRLVKCVGEGGVFKFHKSFCVKKDVIPKSVVMLTTTEWRYPAKTFLELYLLKGEKPTREAKLDYLDHNENSVEINLTVYPEDVGKDWTGNYVGLFRSKFQKSAKGVVVEDYYALFNGKTNDFFEGEEFEVDGLAFAGKEEQSRFKMKCAFERKLSKPAN